MNDTSSPGVGTNAGMESNATVNQTNPTPEVVTVAPVTSNPVVESEPVAPAPTPIKEETPVTTVSETPVVMEQPAQQQVEAKPVEQSSDISVEKEEPKDNKENNNEENKEPAAKKKFPYAVVIIMVLLVIIALLYYFLWITPTRVFDKAINNSIDSIKNVITGIKETENDTLFFSINTTLRTAGNDTKNVEDISFVDGLKVNSDVEMDLKKFNIGAYLYSDLKETTDMRYPDKLGINFDYIDNEIYIKLGEKTAKYDATDTSNSMFAINYDRLNNAMLAFEKTKNEILDIIQDSQLNKTLTTKKINDQTTLAIKVNCDLDNEDIANIYFPTFEKYVEDDTILEQLASAFAMTKEEVRKKIEYFLTRTVQTQFVNVNLYMNLANTELIGLDVSVGDYYVEINYLNGFYYIDVKVDDNGKDMLNIEVKYDSYYGILDGLGTLETDETYLRVKFDYERKTKEGSTSMVGNELDFKFYDDETDKPFCTLDCTLDTEFNKEINLIDPKEAVSLKSLGTKELTELKTIIEKLSYEYYFVYGKLILNKQPDEYVDNFVEAGLSGTKAMIDKMTMGILGDLTKLTAAQKKKLLDEINKMTPGEVAAYLSSMDPSQVGVMLDLIPVSKQLTIINSMTSEQIFSLLDKIPTKQLNVLFNKMSNKQKLSLINEMSKEQLKGVLGKVEISDQISIINAMNATEVDTLLGKVEEDHQLKIFNKMSVKQQIALLGKMTEERVTPMFDKVADTTKVKIVDTMTAAQLTDILTKITENQQLAVFNKMSITQKINLLGKMTKVQVQSMIEKVEVATQVSIANKMTATQISSLLGKLTNDQSLAIFNKMDGKEKIAMLVKIPKTNLQAMIGDIPVADQVTLVNAMDATQLAKVIDKLTLTQQLAVFAKMTDTQKIAMLLKAPAKNIQAMLDSDKISIADQVKLVSTLDATQLAKVIDKLTIAQQLKVFSGMSGTQKVTMLVKIPAKNLQTMLASGQISVADQATLFKAVMDAGYLDVVIPKPTVAQQKAVFNAMGNADKITLLVKISATNLQKIFDSFTNAEVGGILQLLGTQSQTVQQTVIGKLTPAQQQRVGQIKASMAG